MNRLEQIKNENLRALINNPDVIDETIDRIDKDIRSVEYRCFQHQARK